MTEAASADVVLHNAYVVTMDGALMVLRNGAIAVVGDRIAAVGPSADVLAVAAFPRAAQTLDLAGRILLPGFVNTHVHTLQQLARGIADDVDLLTWLHGRIWPYESHMTKEDSYASTLLCGIELIRSGSQKDLYAKHHNTADGRIRIWFGLRQIMNATDRLLLETRDAAQELNTGIHMAGTVEQQVLFPSPNAASSPLATACSPAPPPLPWESTVQKLYRRLIRLSAYHQTMSAPISQVVNSAEAAAENNPQYDPAKDPKRRPTKSKDPGWKYAFWPDLEDKYKLQCTLCGKIVPSGVSRFKKHLAGGFPIVEKCPKATPEIRKEFHELLKSRAMKFEVMDLDGGRDGEDAEDQGGASSKVAAPASSRASSNSGKRKEGMSSYVSGASEPKRQTKSIADELRKTLEEVVSERHRSKSVQRTMKDYGTKSKEQKDVVDGHVADFLYENCLPLNIVNSRSWEILLESIGQYGADYITPSYHEVRIPLLEKAKVKTDALKEKHEKAWKEYGCTLMSDGWTDMSGRHLMNFLANSPEGTFFLGTANVSAESVDANLVAKLLGEQIEAIGPENVVQVVSDNGSNYKAGGRLLMEKYLTLYWTPCAAHCLDLMLEDIGKIKEFSDCIAKAKRTRRFIYAHTRLLDLMRSLNGKKDIVRPGATRFATSFLTLTSMWSQRQSLKAMFVSAQWFASKLKVTEAGKAAEKTVLSQPFWNSVENCMRASQPLLRVLRIVDGDEIPAMPEIWAAMDVAKTHIKNALEERKGCFLK
ncbi:hypothetical protein ACQ4PT_008394 [Festuca glaucescens]